MRYRERKGTRIYRRKVAHARCYETPLQQPSNGVVPQSSLGVRARLGTARRTNGFATSMELKNIGQAWNSMVTSVAEVTAEGSQNLLYFRLAQSA